MTTTPEVQVIEVPERLTAVVRGRVAPDGIPQFLGQAFGDVMRQVAEQGAHVYGSPFARYQPTEDESFDIEAGFLVDRVPAMHGQVEASSLPGGKVARILHVGAYGDVGPVYAVAERWLTVNGYVPVGSPWETYLDGPEVASPRTEVLFPCRRRANTQAAPHDGS
jgi:effector-binding domain-containing protein